MYISRARVYYKDYFSRINGFLFKIFFIFLIKSLYYTYFFYLAYYLYINNIYKRTTMRKFRELRDDTKLRISQKLKGRSMSDTHKQAISDGMKAYWATIPNMPSENNESKKLFNDEKSM